MISRLVPQAWRTKGEHDTLLCVAMSRCQVSFQDEDGMHSVEVTAETLFEAVAQAVAEFQEDKTITTQPSPQTDFTVVVLRPPVEHTIRLKRVQTWAQQTAGRGGPAEMLRRERVRKMLGCILNGDG